MKRTIVYIILWLSILPCFSAPVIVSYTNALAVSHFSPSVMSQVGQLKWFFAHASVGDRIMSGIELLHAANPDFYRFTRSQVDGFPPANTQAGVIYDYMRDNPPWQTKVDDFAGYVANGWQYPRVDIIMNKFCWIDQDADVNYYISRSSALESSNQNTRFVYVTMPLDTTEGADNYLRNVFNDTLRSWVRANNRVLYDVADIEAHDRNGVEQTFVYTNGQVCQKLFPGYTSDGGHPDDPQAKQNLAKGLYAVGVALLKLNPNLVVATKGTYYGLVADTNGVAHQSAGYFTMSTTARGGFSAKLLLGGKSYSLSGSFDGNGQAVLKPNKLPLQIAFGFSSTDCVAGTLNNGVWTAALTADKVVFGATNPCPFVGQYTVVIPGAADGPGPVGHGWGTLSVNAKGSLKLSGSLADGTRITQATVVSGAGNWPLYAMLYGGQGSIFSPVSFSVQSNLNGLLTWTKPGQSKSARYSGGFTNQVTAVGSKYQPPMAGTSITTWTTGAIAFSGGELPAPFTNNILLGRNDRVSNTSSNKLTMSFARSSGIFRGTVAVPQTTRRIPFQGALLQDTGAGYGYFLGSELSGRVSMSE